MSKEVSFIDAFVEQQIMKVMAVFFPNDSSVLMRLPGKYRER
jgi:hypothetical protein